MATDMVREKGQEAQEELRSLSHLSTLVVTILGLLTVPCIATAGTVVILQRKVASKHSFYRLDPKDPKCVYTWAIVLFLFFTPCRGYMFRLHFPGNVRVILSFIQIKVCLSLENLPKLNTT